MHIFQRLVSSPDNGSSLPTEPPEWDLSQPPARQLLTSVVDTAYLKQMFKLREIVPENDSLVRSFKHDVDLFFYEMEGLTM